MYTPEYLTPWARPKDYYGQEWYGYYSACGRHRDSDVLDRANFISTLKALGFDGESEPEVYIPGTDEYARTIVRANHWAVGWVEWIAIHKSDIEGLKIADELAKREEDYPILDESLYSELEDNDCNEVWTNCFSPKERLNYLRKHISRYSNNPIYRQVRSAVAGSWYDAANLLPCPSDILY